MGYQDHGATVNEWVGVVRRAELDRTVKLVALTLASYASPDGSRVYPGLARITVQCRIGYAAAKRAFRVLREVGLVELVRRGNRRAGRCDEYRLILGPDLLEKVDVPNPEQERKVIEAVKDADREASRERYRRRRSRVTADPEPVDNPPDRPPDRGPDRTPTGTFTGHTPPVKRFSRVTTDREPRVTTDPPPSIGTLPNTNPPEIPTASGPASAAPRESTSSGPQKPWADLQHRYHSGQLDTFHVIEEIEQAVGVLDAAEERTADGMLSSGAHVKAIANKIRADRRTARYGTCHTCGTTLDPSGACGNRRCTSYGTTMTAAPS